MVGRAGLEPALPKGQDLQSGAVPTTLYRPMFFLIGFYILFIPTAFMAFAAFIPAIITPSTFFCS